MTHDFSVIYTQNLPASTATPERTFSATKILKTHLRSRLTLTDENMQESSMTYIHKNTGEVISYFALKK